MILDQKPYTLDRVVRLALTVALLWGVVSLLNFLSDVLIPFAVALLLAYLLNPLVSLVQKKIKKRVVAVAVSLLFLTLVATVCVAIVFPMIGREISHTADILSRAFQDSEIRERSMAYFPPDVWEYIRAMLPMEKIQETLRSEDALSILAQLASRALPGVWGFITGTAGLLLGVIGLFIILLYLVFLLLDFEQVSRNWKELIPSAYRTGVTRFVSDFQQGMHRYFRAQAGVAAIVGILLATGFWIIGLPMGILLGLFIGLLNMVPYLQIIGIVPAFFLAVIQALETGGSIWGTVGLAALVMGIVQIIQDGFLVPRIMGKTTGLSPVMILLSLSIWGKLLGLLGLLIALPMTCLLLAYYRRFLDRSDPGNNEIEENEVTF